jgi:hypothetical protein
VARVYHPYHLWEEHKFGLWKNRAADGEMLQKAIVFTGDAELYGSFMMRVIVEWPFSCEQNLLDPSINRQAWLGHAACCLAIGSPEATTRKAWWYLSQKQQDEANAKASYAISDWETNHRHSIEREQLCLRFS